MYSLCNIQSTEYRGIVLYNTCRPMVWLWNIISNNRKRNGLNYLLLKEEFEKSKKRSSYIVRKSPGKKVHSLKESDVCCNYVHVHIVSVQHEHVTNSLIRQTPGINNFYCLLCTLYHHQNLCVVEHPSYIINNNMKPHPFHSVLHQITYLTYLK